MAVTAAGAFRRSPIERSDQRVSWERADRAFFAAGACHVLAWVCRDSYPDRSIELAALSLAGERHPFHVYASWGGWAFDSSGWNAESELLAVNASFEGRAVGRAEITVGLAAFCAAHLHRPPDQFWRDPLPRARRYVHRHRPPWAA